MLGRSSANAESASALKREQVAPGVAVPVALRSANGQEFSVTTSVSYPARRAARTTGSVYWPACESPTSAIRPRLPSACHTHRPSVCASRGRCSHACDRRAARVETCQDATAGLRSSIWLTPTSSAEAPTGTAMHAAASASTDLPWNRGLKRIGFST